MKFTLLRLSFLPETASNWLMPFFMLLFFTENTPLGCFGGMLLYWKLFGWNYCWLPNSLY